VQVDGEGGEHVYQLEIVASTTKII
jgi:hypothetical protein